MAEFGLNFVYSIYRCLPSKKRQHDKGLKSIISNVSYAWLYGCLTILEIRLNSSAEFNKSLINDALTKTLSRRLKTGFGYYIAMEKSKYSGFHIHLMLTFSQGSKYSFTILNEARDCLYALDGVSTAIAFPRKTERSVSIDTADYYTVFKDIKKTNNYFHDLKDTADFKDAVYRYSYLSKEETKLEEELKGIRHN